MDYSPLYMPLPRMSVPFFSRSLFSSMHSFRHRTAVCFFCAQIVVFSLVFFWPTLSHAKGLTCDFYDISDLPAGWKVIVPPGFNERKSSLGQYVNEEKNTYLMIQVSENTTAATLEEVTAQTLISLRSNGCRLLKEPLSQGELTRLEVTRTGTPSVMWIGTDGDVTALTVLCGDLEEGKRFLSFIHASNKLIPSADLVVLP